MRRIAPLGTLPMGCLADTVGCRSCENALAVCDRSAKDSDAMEGLSGDRASGPDRRHQGADTQDGNDAVEVVGQDVEAHLRADPLQRAGQEVRRAHPGLDGAERVLHGLPPDAHDIWCLIQAPLHGVDDSLMLPALDATLLAGRALRLDRAGRAGAGPVVPQGQTMLNVIEPPGQPLASTAICAL